MAYKVVYGQEVPLITTWEWIDGYALRSMMYPAYLSIPLSVLKALSIDTNFLVVNSMLAMNSLLQVMGDFFLYLLAKRMIGREGALIAVTYSLFNQKINDIFQKTLTNGAEAALCMCGLYYFSKLKPKFDTNLAIMTISITLAFLVRSSSLVGWVPLALYKIFSGFDYFIAIVTAGIVIAIPVCVLSVLIDSAYYGRFTIPQWNFVYINVVDNISKYFGTEHWSYYIIELRDCIAFSEMFFKFILLGMCFYSIYLSAGVLPFDKKEKSEKFQGFIIFIITNVLILSLIEHKEQRFMTQIFPLFAIYWAFFWLVIIRVSQAVD